MKIICLIYVAFLVFFSCSISKKEYEQLQKNKVIQLEKLSSYLINQHDKTYDFLYDKIKLPKDYEIISWTTEFKESFMGGDVDSIFNKYLIYGKMLDNLLINDENHKLHYQDIIQYYGQPSSISNRNHESVSVLYYYFNTLNHPKCSSLDDAIIVKYKYCAMIYFKFDEEGYLIGVHTSTFHP